ncbi:MAG: CYTH domain-containing protein [Clostridiales bacterium]|nr:CYTH domain-containing protein [Clostridiales bacterium]
METEVKLAFKDKESLFSAVSTDWFKSRCQNPDSRPVTLENFYLDTEDRILAARGVSFRKRHYTAEDTDFFEYTAKYKGEVKEGVHNHFEWNLKSVDGVLDLESFKLEAEGDDLGLLSEILSGIKEHDLKVLCSNVFDRTYYDFRFGNSTMEASVDYGEIKDSKGKACDLICELELELKEGTVEDLESAKAKISADLGGVPFDETKLARTLRASMSGGAS